MNLTQSQVDKLKQYNEKWNEISSGITSRCNAYSIESLKPVLGTEKWQELFHSIICTDL